MLFSLLCKYGFLFPSLVELFFFRRGVKNQIIDSLISGLVSNIIQIPVFLHPGQVCKSFQYRKFQMLQGFLLLQGNRIKARQVVMSLTQRTCIFVPGKILDDLLVPFFSLIELALLQVQ